VRGEFRAALVRVYLVFVKSTSRAHCHLGLRGPDVSVRKYVHTDMCMLAPQPTNSQEQSNYTMFRCRVF